MRTPSTGMKMRNGLVNEVRCWEGDGCAIWSCGMGEQRSAADVSSSRFGCAAGLFCVAAFALNTVSVKLVSAFCAASRPSAGTARVLCPLTPTFVCKQRSGSVATAVRTLPAGTNATPSGRSSGAAVPGEALENGTGEADPPALSESDPKAPDGDAPGVELDGADPFVRSQKLAPAMVAAGLASTAEAAAPPAVLPTASTVVDDDAGLHAETLPGAISAEKETASGTSEPLDAGRGGHESPTAACGNPFASRSNIPRTPTDQVAPLPQSLPHTNGVADAEDGGAEPVDAGEAQLRIGELRQELACMADRLAKQGDERKRLADVAFEAQDEAIKLRQQLQDMQEAQSQRPYGDEGGGAAPESNGGGGAAADDGAPHAIGGKEGDTATPPSAAVVEIEDRVLQLEIEKLDAEKLARSAFAGYILGCVLNEANRTSCVRDLAQSAEARYTEMLEEKLRSDRERCQARERAIEEHQIKVKIFIAEKRAEMLSSRVSEEERVRAEQDVRAAAVAVAGKACKVVREFVARNERMSRRVAGLRENVKEREERVSQLKEASARLEASGRCARSETETVREQLAAAMEELEATKRSRQDLEERLGPLEKDCLEAQAAQERLRHLVDAEEARRVSVEQRLSEIKHHGDETEKSRRLSVERRLDYAERARAELSETAANVADRPVEVAPVGAAPSAPLVEPGVPSPSPAPKKKAGEGKKAKVAREKNRSKAKAVAPGGGSAGKEERLSPVSEKVAKRARAAGEAGRGKEESPPAKVRRDRGGNTKNKSRKGTTSGDSAEAKEITTSGVGETTPSRGSGSDTVRDKAPEVPVREAPVPAGTTTTTGRLGRKRKQVNYAESSADLDSSDEDVAAAVRSHRAQGRRYRTSAGEKAAAARSRRSVIASLSDASSDESEGGIADESTAFRGKKKAAPAAAGREKKEKTVKAVDGAGMVKARSVESASDEATQGESRSSAEEASTHGEGGGEGNGEAARTLPLSRSAKEGSAPDTIPAVARTRERSTSDTPAREEPLKKKKRRSSISKARKSRKAAKDKGAGGRTGGSADAAAFDEKDSVPDKAAVRRGEKAGRVGSVGPSKAVQQPTQVHKELTSSADTKGLLSTDLSPIPPPPQKRSRKLLGAGTSRCKTPKAMKTTDIRSTISGDDTASPPTTTAAAAAAGPSPPPFASADAVRASVPAAAPAAPVVATAMGPRSGVGPKSGAFRAQLSTVHEATALKPLKLSTNSILAMRGKSTMRTSMFKSFLDPKQGFKAPKLKPGASRS
ncbi:unnamed protein product [Scytosiphon promiscuus]